MTDTNAKIEASDAQELYEALYGDHGYLGVKAVTAGPWTLVGSSPTDDGRWHYRYYLVVQDEEGSTWGLRYGIGLTEDQEDDLPWEDAVGSLDLTRLYPYVVTRVEYRRSPPR